MEKYIDIETALKYVGNIQFIYDKLVKEFVENYHNFAIILGDSLSENNYQEAFRLIHTLKGISKNLGAIQLHSEILVLEAAILEKNVTPKHLQKFLDVYHKSYHELKEISQKRV